MQTSREHRPSLDWSDCVGLIVGIMLGTGIFAVFPKLAAEHNPSSFMILATWVLGTLVALCGAFCFAELTALFPRNGGEYVFLKEAFGRDARSALSFLFAWAQIFVIRPASLVSLAIILSVNAYILVHWIFPAIADIPGAERTFLYIMTMGTVVFFSFTTLIGVHMSKWMQNAFTLLKIGCLALLIGVGIYLGKDNLANLHPILPPPDVGLGSILKNLGMALIPVMWVFGGWNEAPYIAADIRDPASQIPRALIVGVAGLGLLYVLINLVYILHLTPAGLASSWTFASDLMKMWFGPIGEVVMALTLILSTAGAVNGLTLTGARMTQAFAEDMGLLVKDDEGPSYFLPLMINLLLVIILTLLLECEPESIDRLLVFTAGVVWLFFALVAGCVFVFRRKPPPGGLPYKSPLYPLTPLVFILMCGYMLYGAWEYKPFETLCGIAALLAGVPVYLLGLRALESSRRGREKA